jgi:hypothetical protein
MDRDAVARDMTASVHSERPANRDGPHDIATVTIVARRTEGSISCFATDVFAQRDTDTGHSTQMLLHLLKYLLHKYIGLRPCSSYVGLFTLFRGRVAIENISLSIWD